MKLNKSHINRVGQDATLDQIATGDTAFKPSSSIKVPLSLKPGQTVMDGCVEHHFVAMAIRDAWRPAFKTITMSSAELDELSERCAVVFVGKESERA